MEKKQRVPSIEKQNTMKTKRKGVTEKEKHGCFNCRWCKKVSYMDTPCMDFYCKQHSKFDFVTGQVEYEPCRNVTNCDKWEIGKNLVCRMRESMQVLTHAAPIKDMDGKELKPVAALEYAQSIIDEVEAFMEKERNKQYEFMKGEEWK